MSAVQQLASLLRELSLLSRDDDPLVLVGFDDAHFAALAVELHQPEVLRLKSCGSLTLALF